jgi:predicted lipoprotein with Yx(FWY)xxD motif
VKTAKRGNLGTILVTARGKALYKYGADRPNDPTCTGSCAAVWPPLLVAGNDKSPAGVSGLGSVKVAGGKRQVTYRKMPLYLFASDSGTSVKGQNVGGFSVIHATTSATATASTANNSGGSGY